jgi:thioredoxin 1
MLDTIIETLQMLDTIIETLSNNPVLVVVACYVLWNFFQKSQPFPESGGLVKSVKSAAEWNETLKSGNKTHGGTDFVLADFYATVSFHVSTRLARPSSPSSLTSDPSGWHQWCPPCRSAVPVYGKMSLEFSTVRFVKVDVDQCREVSSKEGIQAMPTFKLYKDGKECDSVQGFSEANIRAMLTKAGIERCPASVELAKSD